MDRKTSRDGLIYGASAYVAWGLIPLYFKQLTNADMGPLEILAHRLLWSFLLLGAIVSVSRRWREFGRALTSPTTTLTLVTTTLLIGVNWLTFLYAVSTGRVLQASLAYFATPLLNVLLGVVFLKERLRFYQMIAIVLACIGLGILAMHGKEVPWIALVIALSFVFYGLLRKTVAVDGVLGLLFETLGLTPFGVAYLIYLHAVGHDSWGAHGIRVELLLFFSGAVTATPLLLFAAAVRRMRLSTLGILQYLSPTIQFFLAVVVFGEAFSREQLYSFAFIWAAVAIYCADSWQHFRQTTAAALEAELPESSLVREPAAGIELDA